MYVPSGSNPVPVCCFESAPDGYDEGGLAFMPTKP